MIKKIIAIILVNMFLLNYGFGYWKPNHRLAAYGFSFSQDTLLLEPLLKEASENNPDILAAKKRWEASKARIPQAKSLEDPSIGLGFQYTPGSPFQFNKTPSAERALSFSQFLPFFGKLSLKGKIAVVESQMRAADYKNTELKIINQVKNAYYDLFMTDKEIELKNESLRLLEGIAQVAEANYAVQSITQEEVYKVHLEIANLNNNIVNLEQEKRSKCTRLNTLLNRDAEGVLGIPDLEQTFTFKEDIKLLYQETLINQPELLIFSYSIEKNKHAKSLAKKSFFPDLMASIVERGITSGTIGPWDLMLSFTLPLWFWTKQRYEVKEAIANLEEAQAAYKAMQNRAFSEVKDFAVKIKISQNKIKLYKTSLIPILESSIEASQAAFASGKGDFMMLVDTHRMLVEAKMNYYKILVDYNMNLADLERIVGINLK